MAQQADSSAEDRQVTHGFEVFVEVVEGVAEVCVEYELLHFGQAQRHLQVGDCQGGANEEGAFH